MVRADKLLNQMRKSLMTDKLLLCLLLLLILGIVVIIVVKALGIDIRGNGSQGVYILDCSLDWARNSKECQQLTGGQP